MSDNATLVSLVLMIFVCPTLVGALGEVLLECAQWIKRR